MTFYDYKYVPMLFTAIQYIKFWIQK